MGSRCWPPLGRSWWRPQRTVWRVDRPLGCAAVPTAPKPRELDLARIRRWARDRVPVEHEDNVRVEVGVRGANVTVFERRPPWCEEGVVPPPGGAAPSH